jgi:hypothetical protein
VTSGRGHSGKDCDELLREVQQNPDNVSLRVSAAASLRQLGRIPEAVAMYKSVVASYQSNQRFEQAKVVARTALELAPNDDSLRRLLFGDSVSPSDNAIDDDEADRRSGRHSTYTPTPLPAPMPYHVAEPTRGYSRDFSDAEFDDSAVATDPLLSQRLNQPAVDVDSASDVDRLRVRSERRPTNSGLSAAARKISQHLAGQAAPSPSSRPASVEEDVLTQRISRVELTDTQADSDHLATRKVERVSNPNLDNDKTPVR